MWIFITIAIAVVLLIIIAVNIKIVPQSKAYVIERLGSYYKTWETGLHMLIPNPNVSPPPLAVPLVTRSLS